MANVAINGLGRIGRATLKIVFDAPELDLVAVNDLATPEDLAYLLKYDSVYGRYGRSVEATGDGLVVDGRTYPVLNEKDPARLPWKSMNVDLVFECTGVFADREGFDKHLRAGARKAILSAPSKSDGMRFVVPGVNAPEDERMISCASCTTNCIAPPAEIMGRRIGVRKAIMTTVHAYTSSQSIVDAPSKRKERGRAGAANLVPTSTGAAESTAKVLTDYQDRFDGVAVRAPVAVGSLADMTFLTARATRRDEVNGIFREEAGSERYRGILRVTEDPIVSSDIIKDPCASLVDLRMTRVVDGDLVKVMAWYDNEWGYAAQMVRAGLSMVAR
ncbi:glyceraldehyde-3-phosphate dehydrogenase, type I [Methylocaldum marinum]|uniref:Glyceraldehyde-3-phosphate dehydrogenase, type I n=1 Tax=Methylocaldum marinum TaxID=1432792 RepID=A0A250KM85_9GAMM|nr:glyceraldehyde 3-phosphate dehydrogenase NAD-binding domain-containing protein [Methylocaldum marinum]BBA32697.1 glyceraldehyde-3-phosphate dehydrogenase, type I [Methylocaldum marinum]